MDTQESPAVAFDKDLLSRAWQAAMLTHAEVIIRALLGEQLIDLYFCGPGPDGHYRMCDMGLSDDGVKWYDRAEEWLKEVANQP